MREQYTLSVEQAGQLARCSPSSVRRAARFEDIPAIQYGDGPDDWLISSEGLPHLAARGRQNRARDRRRDARRRGVFCTEITIKISVNNQVVRRAEA